LDEQEPVADQRSTEEPADGLAADAHGLYDQDWDEGEWKSLVDRLVADRIVTWREVATTILGELNPPQVGTGIASATNAGWKRNHATLHPGESFMPHVMQWFYAQSGRCEDCGTRLDLQADHMVGREEYADAHEADWLSNLCLRCRRHNVVKRRSHIDRAERTLLPAQQGLMWILLEIRPKTKLDLARLCRLYGMTMAGIRFDEAWAMAVWLNRIGEYDIATGDRLYDLVHWPDGAVTRRYHTADPAPPGSWAIARGVPEDSIFSFFSTAPGETRPRFTEFRVETIPFVYPLGDRNPTDIAVWTHQHNNPTLGPKGHDLYARVIRRPDQRVGLAHRGVLLYEMDTQARRSFYKGRIFPRPLPPLDEINFSLVLLDEPRDEIKFSLALG